MRKVAYTADMKRGARWIVVSGIGLFLLCLAVVTVPQVSHAQDAAHALPQGVWRAEVVAVLERGTTQIPGTETQTETQRLQVRLLEGSRAGELIELSNDFIMMEPRQRFFLNYLVAPDGTELYTVRDLDRRGALIVLSLLFVAVVLIFGRLQGLRSLVSLLGSFVVIMYVLLPLLLRGFDPVVTSILVGALILSVAIFFTHGFTSRSLIAFTGTVVSIGITGLLATLAVDWLSLSGFFSDETVYLNFTTDGLLDFRGLLLGGMIIGVLGVLDDIAITQVAVVGELKHALPSASARTLYTRALRVGREHVSALVNTIVLAYAGVSLPLMLWFYGSDASFGMVVNNEVFATEIARTIVGSIGLILTVPITTALAAVFAAKIAAVHTGEHAHNHAHGHVYEHHK
ncbi:MAG: hypothetical protein RL150_654 [Candidatus Parcubacteria bacterium]|jgi:uncharacterized membrane protein